MLNELKKFLSIAEGKRLLYNLDGKWVIDCELGNAMPVERFGLRVKNGEVDLYYFRDKPHTWKEEPGYVPEPDDKPPNEDFGTYYVDLQAARKGLRGYTYRDIMMIGIKRIPLKDLKVGNRGRSIYFEPAVRNAYPGVKVK